ncbi:MAG: hypothetical protein ABSD38_36870 [Syntrophorhabdales bacterium]|jgi:hypothetical protein
MIVPVIGGVWGFYGGPSINADGSPDDTPVRAAALLLFLTPAMFFIILLAWYFTTKRLAALNVLSTMSLFLSCVAVSILLGDISAVGGYGTFGPRDAAISFVVFFSYTFARSGIGALGWWLIGFVLHNHRLRRIEPNEAGPC